MTDKDYLEAFEEAKRAYGESLVLTSPKEDGGLYRAKVSGGGVFIEVASPYLAPTLYAFLDALELMEEQGIPPLEHEPDEEAANG